MNPWPASAISEDEMAMLYIAREASMPRVPITELIRRAVVDAYGQRAVEARYENQQPESPLKAA